MSRTTLFAAAAWANLSLTRCCLDDVGRSKDEPMSPIGHLRTEEVSVAASTPGRPRHDARSPGPHKKENSRE